MSVLMTYLLSRVTSREVQAADQESATKFALVSPALHTPRLVSLALAFKCLSEMVTVYVIL